MFRRHTAYSTNESVNAPVGSCWKNISTELLVSRTRQTGIVFIVLLLRNHVASLHGLGLSAETAMYISTADMRLGTFRISL